MNCVICGTPAGMFAHKCLSGPVCGDCYSKTPSFFQVKNENVGVIRHICRTYDNENEKMCKVFRETCKIGNFHFDGDSLLAVIGKIKKDGCIEDECSDVFSMENIKDVSFSMINTKVVSDKKVSCDIVFTCTFHDTFWKINEIVSKEEVCFAKKEGDNFTFDLPVGVQIVWDEIIKKVNASRTKIEKAINNELPTESDLKVFKAKTLFMLEKGYTKEDVLSSYWLLISAFKEDERKVEIINNAKDLLLDFISES